MENLNLVRQNKDLQVFEQIFKNLKNKKVIINLTNINLNENKINKKYKNNIIALNLIYDFLHNIGINQIEIDLYDFMSLNNGFDFLFYNINYYDILGDNLFLYTFQIMNLDKILKINIDTLIKNLNKLNRINILNSGRIEEINGGNKKQKGGLNIKIIYFIFLYFLFFIQAGYSNLFIENKQMMINNSRNLVSQNYSKEISTQDILTIYSEIKFEKTNNQNILFDVYSLIQSNFLFFSYFINNLINGKTIKQSLVHSTNNALVNEKTKKNPLYKSLKDYLLGKKEEKKNNKKQNGKCPKCICKCECEFNKK